MDHIHGLEEIRTQKVVVGQSLYRSQKVADLEGPRTQMEALEVDHTQMEVLGVDHIRTVADQEVHYSEGDRREGRMKAHIQDCSQLEADPVEGQSLGTMGRWAVASHMIADCYSTWRECSIRKFVCGGELYNEIGRAHV